MVTEAQLPGLQAQVVGAAFGLAVVFGAISQRTRFCTMGAVSDIVAIGDWTRMRMWVLAIGTAMIGFNAMVAAGWIEAGNTIYAAPRVLWLSTLVGGALFGFGMVLASGCGARTLVRIGAGNLKSVVVLVVLGVAAFATLRGITGVARVATVDAVGFTLATGQDLPSVLAAASGVAREMLALGVGVLLGLALIGWAVSAPEGRSGNVLLGGLGIGGLVVAVWWVSGVLGHLPEHPITLDEVFLATNTRRMESLSFVAPVAFSLDWLMFFSDASKTLSIGIASVAGVITGAAVQALASRSFRWEGFRNVADTGNHLVGAVLMGVGGVTALGCTVGQGISGVSTLSISSFIALAGIVLGALASLRWQQWRIEREA